MIDFLDTSKTELPDFVMQGADSWNMYRDEYKVLKNLLYYFLPSKIVELGTGCSTRLFCHYAMETGAQAVTSIEEKPDFKINRMETLAKYGLAEWSDIQACPVQKVEYHGKEFMNYDVSGVVVNDIDFLLIDSPHRAFGRESSLYLFEKSLSPDAVIVHNDSGNMTGDEVEKFEGEWMKILPGYEMIHFLCQEADNHVKRGMRIYYKDFK